MLIRQLSQKGIDLIKQFEGFSDKVYLDAVGLPTIGYGHLVKPGEAFGVLTPSEAEDLLRKDVSTACRAVSRLSPIRLNDNQFASLVSFVYNLGSGTYQRSTLRQVVNRGDFEDVPEQILRWNKAGGRVLRGLTRRRQAEVKLWLDRDLSISATGALIDDGDVVW